MLAENISAAIERAERFVHSLRRLMLPLVLSALYAFLSIRFEGVCILDFLRYASAFFLFKSQTYVWRPRYEEQ